MKGWLDNFGKADNANDSNVSLPEGFVGLAYNIKGRNYSPAWGGQFEYGGEIAQRGKKIDQILNANKNLDWVKGLYDPNYGSIQIPGQEGRSTHFMESADRRVYPTIRKIDGELIYLGDDAYNYADSTNSYIEFPTDKKAQKFAKNYKRGTGVLDFQQGGTIPIAQNGVSDYMKKKIKEKQDESIAAQYDLPEVVVQGFRDPSPFEQAGRMPQYTPSPTVPYLEKTKDPAEFFKSWITSPEYRRRKIETDYPEYAEYSPVTGDEIDDPYKGPLIDRAMRNNFLKLEQIQRPGAITYDPKRRSEYFVEGEANVNPKDFAGDVNTVKAHEIAHAVDTNVEDLSNEELKLLTSATEGWAKKLPKNISPELWEKMQLAQHLEKPTELKADLNALRFLMYDKDIYDIRKGEKFTKEHLEKAKEKLKGNQSFDRTLMVTGDENLINLMNIIAKKDEELTPIAMNGTSMPGAVGFTYARVAGAAPSKGKYAKKTMASAQNGQEMRFYQNGLDWKPKSMQNGGDEIKFNPVTNEYELPEVVVEGKDERIKNAMSQGMANFYGHVGELMSAPQKEMMQLITGKEQTPSQAFGFQNTGGWLDSPTSFGKNLLNTGLDFGLDPLNIVGVGLADDVFKLGIRNVGKNLTENLGKGIGKRAISQSPSPQMFSDDLGKIEVPNVSKRSDLEGTGFDQDKLYHLDLFEKKKQQVIDRLSTKKGRERLQRFINENYKKNPEAFGTNILELKNPYLEFLKTGFKDYKKFTPDQIIDNVKNLQFFESGDPLEAMFNYSVKNNNRKFGLDTQSPFGISVGESFTPYDALHILEHELGHFFQRVNKSNVDEILSKLELDDQAKNFELNRPKLPLEDAGFSQTIKKNAFTNAKASRNYFTAGTKGREKMPFLAEVRENLLQRGLIDDYYDDITPEILKKHKDLYDKTGGNKYILRLYEIMKDSPENFNILSNAINKMPQVALPIAGGAAATISALQNQQPVQKQKNGGITKDNLGYWNPDNWGKPVEIGSNNITMEGVYEPLLGISDTGDTKLMQPGKNYKFKGKKVTEFPVAKLGINQLDAQPMKKLNQLLNFTNNPDKDNWLDKYN